MLMLRSGLVRRRSKLQWQLLGEATWRSGSGSRWHPGKGLKAWLHKMQIPGKCDLLFTALNFGGLLVSPKTFACVKKADVSGLLGRLVELWLQITGQSDSIEAARRRGHEFTLWAADHGKLPHLQAP